ncbi:ABC transporter permease [Mucilaginibacter auburnensis]|uniref:Putative ABC transport system permease protein n=1 Tax=Mucilaginibacter auburnensis TaxID=1457233 RepID=A0A2H9VLN7_9SPHI|nr:ABC transporter permease [Mucilaginibacter auburnensis]PJJ79233.1 putative ABC transport system permease protein [Mucilaginibacter auburnensis]
MFKNYLKIAWRNLYKHKAFSLIHILGLTTGVTVCLMIFLYITNEFSVDKFHTQGKNIYRLMRRYDPTKPLVAYVSGPYAPALKNDFPSDIKTVVRVKPENELVTFGDKAFNEKKVYYADAGFFNLFSYPLIKGEPSSVLKLPNSVVLNEKTAKRYFGSAENAMGKVLTFGKRNQFKVAGIAKDLPSNTHLDFDIVAPIAVMENYDWFKRWINNSMFAYVQLNDGINKKQLEQKFPAFMAKYMGEEMKRFDLRVDLQLTPLQDIYFEKSSAFDNVRHGEKSVVYVFISIAILIMLIACINFMNLSTIRAVDRSKEVGLRKVLGAVRNHLIYQFIGESVLLAIIACILAMGLLFILMPYYNDILGYTLSSPWMSWHMYAFLIGVIVVIGLLAGSYPAFFLSGFSPIQALKGKLRLGKGGVVLRQTLVVVQFSISVFLIIGVIVMTRQMNYMKNKQLGYDQSQTVVLQIDNADLYNNLKAFKTQLLSNNSISSFSVMSSEPGGFHDVHSFEVEGKHDPFRARTEFADFDHTKLLNLKIIAGRDLSEQYGTDSAGAILINRTAAQQLGFSPQQAVGKWIKNAVRDSIRRQIVGVVEDYNFLSLRENIEPLVISPGEDWRVVLVKLKPGSVKQGLSAIESAYKSIAPVYPFEYSFLDQEFNATYRTDIRQQTILSIFAGLAIFVACLGLFGLASFTATKRTKEIGVRKVLGSSVQNILILLSKDMLKPVLIATVIAVPIGYYAMQKWLQNFAYQINISYTIFVLAGTVALLIAFFTISFQSIKAALANPVKSLRSE